MIQARTLRRSVAKETVLPVSHTPHNRLTGQRRLSSKMTVFSLASASLKDGGCRSAVHGGQANSLTEISRETCWCYGISSTQPPSRITGTRLSTIICAASSLSPWELCNDPVPNCGVGTFSRHPRSALVLIQHHLDFTQQKRPCLTNTDFVVSRQQHLIFNTTLFPPF